METIVDKLTELAITTPDGCAYRFVSNSRNGKSALNYAELRHNAWGIANRLLEVAEPGDRAILMYAPGLDFVKAFFACLCAGLIPVPCYPPISARDKEFIGRLSDLHRNCEPRLICTTTELSAVLKLKQFQTNIQDFFQAKKRVQFFLNETLVLATDKLNEAVSINPSARPGQPDDVAYLQYTSGSTSQPKGVMVTHQNIVANLEAEQSIFRDMQISLDAPLVSWVPHQHDLGLVAFILGGLFRSQPVTLISPAAFLRSPLIWLETISSQGAGYTATPNFGLIYAAKKIDLAVCNGINLDCLNVLGIGGEPITRQALDLFSEKFKPLGFKSSSYVPCFGLAESTLFVSAGRGSLEPRFLDPSDLSDQIRSTYPSYSKESSSCSLGKTTPNHDIAIVDPETTSRCLPETIGEVWVMGPSVAQGYWKNDEESKAVFGAYTSSGDGPYLRTGDLGFLQAGELFLTGRIKDLIIIRGRNIYPQDLEIVATGAHSSIRDGYVAAVTFEQLHQPGIAIICELRDRVRPTDYKEIAQSISNKILICNRQVIRMIVFLKKGQLYRTTNGKIQRQRISSALSDASLKGLYVWDRSSLYPAELPDGKSEFASLGTTSQEVVLSKLCTIVHDAVGNGVDIRKLRNMELSQLNFDSIRLVSIIETIETSFGVVLPAGDIYENIDNLTLHALAEIIVNLREEKAKPLS